MKDAIFIKVLQHGEDAGLEGTNMALLRDYIEKSLSIDFNHQDYNAYLDPLKQLFNECFRPVNEGKNHILKTEYYFRLIEYRELQESRAAAKSANRNAFTAIGVSVSAMVFCAVLAFTQLNTPLTINKSDLKALIDSSRETGIQKEVKLDSLQMAQILTAIQSSQSSSRAKETKIPGQSQEVSHHELINQYFEDE